MIESDLFPHLLIYYRSSYIEYSQKMSGENNDENDDCPELVPVVAKKIPVTIITGFLGKCSLLFDAVLLQ